MSAAEPTTPRPKSRGRLAGFYVLLVLAAILLVLSAFAVWINRVALNTETFSDTSSELLADDQIRSAIATRAVDELFDNIDVEAELEGRLPKDLQGVGGLATFGLREASYRAVDKALEQPRFQRLFTLALVETHATLVQVLEGDGERVSTDEGTVTLDLRTVILEVADRIGLGEEAQARLPASVGEIVILQSDELDTAQNAFQLLKTLAWFLPILTLLAFGGAVALAPDRRHAVRGVGVALIAVGVLGLLAAAFTGNYLVDSLVEERDTRPAANNAWDILTSLMRSSFRWLIAVGILFVIAWWLAGRSRIATSVRRTLAPALEARWWAYAVLAVVAVILLATGPVNDFARLLSVAILVALGIVWIEVTRRYTMREFPDAGGPSFLDDARDKVEDWWDARRAPKAAPPAGTAADVSGQLANLAQLHAEGKLTDEEFAAAKARILGGA